MLFSLVTSTVKHLTIAKCFSLPFICNNFQVIIYLFSSHVKFPSDIPHFMKEHSSAVIQGSSEIANNGSIKSS